MALQCLGRHADALGAFASALAQDDKSPQLLTSLTEAALKSPLRGKYILKLVWLVIPVYSIFIWFPFELPLLARQSVPEAKSQTVLENSKHFV